MDLRKKLSLVANGRIQWNEIIFLPFQTDNLCEENTDYYGNNYVCGYKNRKDSTLDCQQDCAANSNCKFWSFRKPEQRGNQGLCFLKTKKENVIKDANFTSGTKNCHLPDKGTGLSLSPGRDTPFSLDLIYYFL